MAGLASLWMIMETTLLCNYLFERRSQGVAGAGRW